MCALQLARTLPLMNMSAEKTQDAEFRNIPQARVSPTVSKTCLPAFPCQSEVFAHCPLCSWQIQDSQGCEENILLIWIKPLMKFPELFNSVCYSSRHETPGGSGLTPRGLVLWYIKRKTTLRERRKPRWYSQMEDRPFHPQCLRMKGKPLRNAAE